jgi:hypothetical protein
MRPTRMTATGCTHKNLVLIRLLLSISFAFAVLINTHHAVADEAVDSGWVEFDLSEINAVHEYERITYKHIKISENPAIQTKALKVLRVEVEATNKTEDNIFFDLGIVGKGAEGETLFVFNMSPTLSRISAKATTKIRESRYVLPGTLAKVAKYRVRFLGFK